MSSLMRRVLVADSPVSLTLKLAVQAHSPPEKPLSCTLPPHLHQEKKGGGGGRKGEKEGKEREEERGKREERREEGSRKDRQTPII